MVLLAPKVYKVLPVHRDLKVSKVLKELLVLLVYKAPSVPKV